jgi:hypothetical protein
MNGSALHISLRGMHLLGSHSHGQRTRCHVFHGGEYSYPPWNWQGLGHIEAIKDVPLRSDCGLRAEPCSHTRL